jgi:hypothetical protein
MIPFSRHGRTVTARFSSDEASIILSLTSQLIEMLVGRSNESIAAEDPQAARMGIGALTALPPDPALARLLPNAYRDDDEAASDYRRFTEVSLVERKISNARAVAMSVTATPSGLRRTVNIQLDDAGVQSWLRTLTDLRLVLAERLNITTDDHHTDNGTMTTIYDWLGYLQATLLEEWEVR